MGNGEKCICRRHPCWDDSGKQHSCSSTETPFLTYGYMADGTLVCSCRKFPHVGSVYIHQHLCRGEVCETENAPLLQYDEDKGKCACIAHPCLNDNGKSHACTNPEFPILQFAYNAEGALRCSCNKRFNPPP